MAPPSPSPLLSATRHSVIGLHDALELESLGEVGGSKGLSWGEKKKLLKPVSNKKNAVLCIIRGDVSQ